MKRCFTHAIFTPMILLADVARHNKTTQFSDIASTILTEQGTNTITVHWTGGTAGKVSVVQTVP